MEIFVFASNNLTNIWAGIGARTWAVSKTDESAATQGRKTKSQALKIGSFGILYCNQTQSLTTPFIVYSKPNLRKDIADIWPETWTLPFKILPLGSPVLQLSKEEAKKILPIFKIIRQDEFWPRLPCSGHYGILVH